MPKTTKEFSSQMQTMQTCADCGMPIRRNMRYCTTCGRPYVRRVSLVRSLWALGSFWVTVLLVIYGLTAVLRFVAPVTLRVTCTAQVVPSRLLLVPTPAYTEWLSAGDCSAPRGSVVLLTNVPDWVVAIAERDRTAWSGWALSQLEQYLAPVAVMIPTAEQAGIVLMKNAWQAALADLCAPTWIAQWCKAP